LNVNEPIVGDSLPLIARVGRSYRQPEVKQVAGTVAQSIRHSRLAERVCGGGRVAITVGSRGIAGISRIARAAVDAVRSLDLDPFVVAAMGSHGGGTADGQRALLAELGVTEESVGCPIRSEMETVVLGTNSFGLPICFDRNAHEADGIILLNRIKPHTSFTGRYESGLLKMLTIGLGKREGAAQVHKLGLPGLQAMLPEVGAVLLERTKVVLGIAILENAREHTAKIVAIEPEELLDQEPRLLDESRELVGRLPFDQIDVLLVGELGKNYSGTGLDPNVIGRQRVETMPDLPRPVITRLAVLDLSEETRGNANGIGLADLTCWRIERDQARMVLIPNTLELATLWVTPALAAAVEAHPELAFESEFLPIPLDQAGNVEQERLFPESQRARRSPRGDPATRDS
jgi:hypothetical protein